MFDLNGYNQEVAGLAGDGGSVNNGGFDNNTLTVNQAADTTYGGQVNGNVTFRKKGAGRLIFTAVNSHRGGTEIEGGTLSIAQASSLGYISNTFRAAALRFLGGALEVTASTTLAANSGVTLDAPGGTIATVGVATTLTVDSVVTGGGSLTKTEAGSLQLNNADNDYSGDTNITSGTLVAGAENALSPNSRHILTGDTVSGTLDLAGFNQTIGSLASTGATQANAVVTLGASTLSVGGDNTSDATYAGAINGSGIVRVNTHGVQTLATVDHSAQAWSTEIANGQLSVAANAKLGSGTVTIGINSVTGADDLTVLDLQGVTLANNVVVNATNSAGSSVIQATTAANSTLSGTVTLNRDTFAGAAVTQNLTLGAAVSGAGRLTVVDGGSVILSGSNTFGSAVTGGAGAAIDGGTILRSGTIEAGHSSALGTKHVELGDARTIMTTVIDRATTASLTAGGGTFSITGGSAQSGSFTGVSATVDGNTYLVGDIGKTILVKNEEADPTRNGIYTIVSVSGGTMDLVRHVEFDAPVEMTYGTQFTITNGTYATKSFFMMAATDETCCLPVEVPVRFREELASSNVALLINTDALTVANALDVNATAGTGSITVGGASSLTTGAATFSGNMVLQNLQTGATGIETKTVTLTSATDGSSTGITFSGVISEADTANDTLSIEKTGAGTVTLTGANTYHGTTAVTAGTLQLGTGGSVDDTSFIRIDSGATFGTPVSGYTTDATVSGSGAVSGNLTIGSNVGAVNTVGVLKPGDSTGGLLANAGNQVGTLTLAGDLSLAAATSGATRLDMQFGSTSAADFNDSANIYTRLGDGSFNTWITDDTDGHISTWEAGAGSHDRLNISGTLNLTATGQIKITNDTYTILHGDVFDLLDWTSINAGTFNFGGIYRDGGLLGDLELPTLDAALAWNTALFQSYGILVVVPEPTRMLLLMFGLLGLFFRRRRTYLI
jgi:autotransporter-associated beta strand protein